MNCKRLLHIFTKAGPAGAILPIAIVLATLGSGCGIIPGGEPDEASDAAGPTANPAPAPVESVAASDFRVRSELIFNTRADVSFDMPGEVGEVNVAVGDLVSAGDVLATVATDSVTDLERLIEQIELEMDAAQEAMDAVLGLESNDPLVKARAENELALAESELAQAQVRLEQAREALADFQFKHDLSLGRARQERTQIENALDLAQENLSDFAEGHSERFAVALQNRSQAKVALEAAEEALSDYLPNYNERIINLTNSISQAEQKLDQAREDLLDINPNHADLLSNAKQALAKAEDDLRKARADYTTFSVRAIEGDFRSLEEGENFDVVVLNSLLAAVAAAERSVTKWEEEIEELEAGPKELDLTVANNNIKVLEEQLARLNREMDELRGGPDQAQIRLLEATVQSARERLERTERELAEAEAGVDQLALARLEAVIASRNLDLESVLNRLAKLEAGPDQTELDSLNTAVETATQTIITAREARDHLASGPDEISIAQVQFRIDTAAYNYSEAQDDLDDTVARAPISGMVRVVTVAPGDAIQVDARVIQLVDPRDVSVLGLVETNYIERIRVGSPARVTLAAMPGTVFDAEVSEISDEARTERGIISFPVTFRLIVPGDVTIPPNPGLVTTTVLP